MLLSGAGTRRRFSLGVVVGRARVGVRVWVWVCVMVVGAVDVDVDVAVSVTVVVMYEVSKIDVVTSTVSVMWTVTSTVR